MSFFLEWRKNTIFSPEKSLVNSHKYNVLVHLDIVDSLTAGLCYMGTYIFLYINIYLDICMGIIYMASIPSIAKDACYRANEGTKTHLIYSEISLQ